MESAYYCLNCKKDVDAEICPTCFSPTQPKAAKATSTPKPATGAKPTPPPAARPVPPPSRPVAAPASAPSRPAAPRETPPTRPAAIPLPPSSLSTGDSADRAPAHLQDFLDQGYEIFLIAGINQAGKSELLASYRQNGFLDQWIREQGGVIPTNQGEDLKCYPIEAGRRKVVFMDAAGERFRQLYPALRATRSIGVEQIEFLKHISKRLGGVILLLDLRRLWGPEQANDPANSRQVEILAWVLTLLRWLRCCGNYKAGPVTLEEHVNRTVMRLRRRLDIPVQILFSKADGLGGLVVPQNRKLQWLRQEQAADRVLYPAGEDPLLLAYHALPELFEAVTKHANHFRFDFVHAMVADPDTQEIVDPNACGVTLSLQWLLDSTWRQPWPMIPTRHWLGVQRLLDGLTNRGRRWRKGGMPDPVEVRS